MKLKRKIQLSLYALVTIITFRKFYICEDCHRIHKFTGKEFAVCGGVWRPYVFVGTRCADETCERAADVLKASMLKFLR